MKSKKTLLISLLLGALSLSSCSFGEFWEKTKEGFNNAGQTIKEKAIEAFDWSKETAINAYGSVKEGATYVYNKVADWSVETYNTVVDKSKELIGDVGDFLKGLTEPKDIDVAEAFDNNPYSTAKSELFVPYYISSILSENGYQTYNGAVYYKDHVYGGIIFTKNETFIEDDGKNIPECGFVQLVNKGYNGIVISEDMIGTGLIAVSADTDTENSRSFIVQEYCKFEAFSGIIDDTYFVYKPISKYALEIEFKENRPSNYDLSIPLYDFDKNIDVNKVIKEDSEIAKLYKTNRTAYEAAVEGNNAIADFIQVQDNQNDSLVVLDSGFINTILDNCDENNEALNKVFAKKFKDENIGDSTVSKVEADGKINQVINNNEVDSERITTGVITSIGSGLGTFAAGAAAVATVVFCASSGNIVVPAIVLTTAACSIVYNVSNLVEGISDIYYGAKGLKSASNNPVLGAFKKAIPDESIATLVYHIWGLSNTILSGMMTPVAKALQLAKSGTFNFFKSVGAVARASLVYLGKVLITGVAAGFVYKYVDKVLYKITSNKTLSKLVGFGTSVIAGFFTFKGLSAFDRAFNLSGFYVNSVVDNQGIRHYFDDNQVEYQIGKSLKPNTSYTLNGIKYSTDGLGRITNANGQISLYEGERLPIKDKISDIGKGYELPGDDRGHIIGSQLGGTNGLENMMAQNSNLNRGEYCAFENYLAQQLSSGSNVKVDISLNYDGSSFRPNNIIYNAFIDNVSNIKEWSNLAYGI